MLLPAPSTLAARALYLIFLALWLSEGISAPVVLNVLFFTFAATIKCWADMHHAAVVGEVCVYGSVLWKMGLNQTPDPSASDLGMF